MDQVQGIQIICQADRNTSVRFWGNRKCYNRNENKGGASTVAYPHYSVISLETSCKEKVPTTQCSKLSKCHKEGCDMQMPAPWNPEEMLTGQLAPLEHSLKISRSLCSLQISFYRCFIFNLYLLKLWVIFLRHLPCL